MIQKTKSQERREKSLASGDGKKAQPPKKTFSFPRDGIKVEAKDLADATAKRNKMIGAPPASKSAESKKGE